MVWIILGLVVVIVVVLLVASKNGKSSKKTNETSATGKKIELEKTSSTIHFSDDFKSGEPITVKDQNHTITTIYMEKGDTGVWICPKCETENPLSSSICCLCHNSKG